MNAADLLANNKPRAIGSSLTVSPANDLPEETVRCGGKLVIINLQRTPLDRLAHLRIFARTDDVMRMVMAKLAIPIPPFLLTRHLMVQESEAKGGRSVTISGISSDNLPATFINGLSVKGKAIEGEPYKILLSQSQVKEGVLPLRLEFFGHYNEPVLSLPITPSPSLPATSYHDLFYNPLTGEWHTLVRAIAPSP